MKVEISATLKNDFIFYFGNFTLKMYHRPCQIRFRRLGPFARAQFFFFLYKGPHPITYSDPDPLFRPYRKSVSLIFTLPTDLFISFLD